MIESVLRDHAFTDYAIADVYALVGGYVVNDVLSARGTLEPLIEAFRVNAADAGDRVLFRGLARPADAEIDAATLVERADQPLVRRRRAQETELANELVLRFLDPGKDYQLSTAASRRLAGESRRTTSLDLTAIIEFAEAERLTDALLRDIWTGREHAELELPPSLLCDRRRRSPFARRRAAAGAADRRADRGRRKPRADASPRRRRAGRRCCAARCGRRRARRRSSARRKCG